MQVFVIFQSTQQFKTFLCYVIRFKFSIRYICTKMRHCPTYRQIYSKLLLGNFLSLKTCGLGFTVIILHKFWDFEIFPSAISYKSFLRPFRINLSLSYFVQIIPSTILYKSSPQLFRTNLSLGHFIYLFPSAVSYKFFLKSFCINLSLSHSVYIFASAIWYKSFSQQFRINLPLSYFV